MNIMKLHLFPLAGLALLLAACGSSDEPEVIAEPIVEQPTEEPTVVVPKTRTDISLTAEGSKANDAANQFALDFFLALYQHQDKGENLLVSPFSVQAALSMTANGAKGETLNEMLSVMGMQGLSLDDINQYNQAIVKALTEIDNTSVVESANGIWVKKPLCLLDSYTRQIELFYDTTPKSIAFSPDDIASINEWVKARTQGMIPSLYDEDELPKCEMLLANALCFKAVWKNPFIADWTQKGTFTNADGSKTTVDMMFKQNYNMNVAASRKTFDLCAKPYGNGAFSMVLMLPHEGNTLEECIGELARQDWKQLNDEIEKSHSAIALYMPKFELPVAKYDLKTTLIDMGMILPFTLWADFSGMTQDAALMIDKCEQKCTLSVDEKGSQAAAVTKVEMVLTADSTPQPALHDFILNRPFAFLIKEKSTGAILFAGAVNKL